MTPKTFNLSPADITLFLDLARNAFMNTPANIALHGQPREMSEREFHAMCTLKGAFALFTKLGFIDPDVEFVVDHSLS